MKGEKDGVEAAPSCYGKYVFKRKARMKEMKSHGSGIGF